MNISCYSNKKRQEPNRFLPLFCFREWFQNFIALPQAPVDCAPAFSESADLSKGRGVVRRVLWTFRRERGSVRWLRRKRRGRLKEILSGKREGGFAEDQKESPII